MLDRIRQRFGMNSSQRAGGRPSLLRLVLYALLGWMILGAIVSIVVGTVEALSGVIAAGAFVGAIILALYVGYQACGWVFSATLGDGTFDLRLRRR